MKSLQRVSSGIGKLETKNLSGLGKTEKAVFKSEINLLY